METVTIVVANGERFVVERELLISNSDYFKRLLDGSFNDVQDNTITYADINRTAFQDFVVWLHAKNYRPTDTKRAFDLYELQQRFSATNCTLTQFITGLANVKLTELVSYVNKLAPEFDEDLINALARHYRYGDDLSELSEEFVTAINKSPYRRYYGEGLRCDIVRRLEVLAKTSTGVKKRYIFTDTICDGAVLSEVFTAYNVADAVLQLFDWIRLNPPNNYGHLDETLPSIPTHSILKAELMFRELQVNHQVKNVADELYIDRAGIITKDGERYVFRDRKTPNFRNRKALIFTHSGLIIDEFGVIGTCMPTNEPNKFRIVKLVDKFQALIKRSPEPISSQCTYDNTKSGNDVCSEEEQEPTDMLSYYMKHLDQLEINCTVDDIFNTDSDVTRVIPDLIAGYSIHEFS